MQALKQFYIPPLCKLYYERIALEKAVFNIPLFVRIADPESWLVQTPYKKYKLLSKEALAWQTQCLHDYLLIVRDGSVFEGNSVLTLNDSIPYIEWQSDKETLSSADLLGKYSFFIDLAEFEDELEAVEKIIEAIDLSIENDVQIVLIGSLGNYQHFNACAHLFYIDPEKTAHLSFAERFKFKNKNGLTLFNFGSRPYFLVNPKGKLVTFFTKQDQQALVDEITKYIQLDQ